MKYRLSFNADIQQKQSNALRDRIAVVLEQKDFEDITILFSSSGGSTSEAIAIFNFVRSLPVKIRMHAVGGVESAAVPAFLSADTRSCAPFARFYLHQTSIYMELWRTPARTDLKTRGIALTV
jgi:ATP-dependent protease ClpP protease subunit